MHNIIICIDDFGYSCEVYQRIVYDLHPVGLNIENRQNDHVS